MAVQPSFCIGQLAKQNRSVLLWELAQLREKINTLQEQAYDELYSSSFQTWDHSSLLLFVFPMTQQFINLHKKY